MKTGKFRRGWFCEGLHCIVNIYTVHSEAIYREIVLRTTTVICMWEANHSKLMGNGSWLWGPDNIPNIPAAFEGISHHRPSLKVAHHH